MNEEYITEAELKSAVEELTETFRTQLQPILEREGEDPLDKKQADRIQDRLDELESKVQKGFRQRRERDENADRFKNTPYEAYTKGPSQTTREVFDRALRKGMRSLSADDLKVLSTDDDTAGGYLAPGEFVAELVRDIVEFSPVRSVARVRTTSRGYIMMPTRTGTAAAKWVNQGGSGHADETQNPTYGLERIDVHPLHALALITYEDLEDSAFNREAMIREEFREQFAVSEGDAFITGDGNGKPEGILNGGIGTVQSLDATKITSDALINQYYDLKSPYSDNGLWMLNRKSIREIRKLKDNDDRYIWQMGIEQNRPPTILGAEYVEAPDLAAPDENGEFAAGEKPVLFGDWPRAYVIVDRVQLSIQRLVEKYSDQGAVAFKGRRRVGGQIYRAEAANAMVIGT